MRNGISDVSKQQEKKAILVNGYAYPSVGQEILSAWLPDLTFVSTFSYGFTPQGSLINLDDYDLRIPSAAVGVQSLMVLTPLDEKGAFNNQLVNEMLESKEAQENLIGNIQKNLKLKNMFGVDFDFEYVLPENKDKYVMLVAEATEVLNKEGYLVTVALAPKVSADQKGLLYEGHDYKAMGKAANFVLLMTYEWGYTYGPPLPVAPIPSVRRVLDYGVTEIPPDKILMGMPNYGYDWTLPFVKGKSKAEKLSNPQAVARAEYYGAEIMYDEEAKSPYYNYLKPVPAAMDITLETIEPGVALPIEYEEHIVWFEDERSWSAKLELVKEYGFAGISIWNVMSVFPGGQKILREMFKVAKI